MVLRLHLWGGALNDYMISYSEHGQSCMPFLLAFPPHPPCTVNVSSWATPCFWSKEIIYAFAAYLLAGMLTCTQCYGELSKTTMFRINFSCIHFSVLSSSSGHGSYHSLILVFKLSEHPRQSHLLIQHESWPDSHIAIGQDALHFIFLSAFLKCQIAVFPCLI